MRWPSGDYQIAPIAARSTAMGRWRLTPPGYWGDTAYGREIIPGGDKYYACAGGGDALSVTASPCHLSPCGSVRGFDTPPACHSIPRTPQGEGLGDKKKRPGALLLALFIAFCRCRSGPSGTGVTGRRRGLRRGRRSWENPWHRRSWCRWWAGSSNSRRRREPSPTWL